ncbi:MAG: nitronate monooxygenase [Woeseiaceae bacterium]|nr:nitronate monooxygenase [Woeseiaceae bacterium]
MKLLLCDELGIEFPLFAFSHCRDVVAAVSRAGGMGVLGAVTLTPEELDVELRWIQEHTDGKPYGLDLIVPETVHGKGKAVDEERLLASIPDQHTGFVETVLSEHGIDPAATRDTRASQIRFAHNLQADGADELLEVAMRYPIRLIANALGVPPQRLLDRGKQHGIPVAALVGSREQALKQADAGVDIIIAAGGEAGGHCSEISTMVLVPEVVEAIAGRVPVLAAGGIVTGRQMAACMAMGAAGAWTGSVWLTTAESEATPVIRDKLVRARSRDTVRSRSRTGKPSRQLRSAWTDAWETGSLEPLPMPLQTLLTEPALGHIDKLSQSGHAGAQELATYWVGQGVGLMNHETTVRAVMQDFQEDFLSAYDRLHRMMES